MAGLLLRFRSTAIFQRRHRTLLKRGFNENRWIHLQQGRSNVLPRCVRIGCSTHLVEEFVERLADLLEPSCLHHSQIRIGDVPEVGRDLVLHDEVFDLRAANPGPTFDFAELKVQDVGDFGRRSRRCKDPNRRRRRCRRAASCRCPGIRSACRGRCRPCPRLDCRGSPCRSSRNARIRFAALGLMGRSVVSSETFPRRAPIRPALSIGTDSVAGPPDCTARITFSSAVFEISVASA